MKKLFIFLSFIFLISCSVYQKYPVYEKTYSGKNAKIEATNDIHWWLDAYKTEPIPFDDWLTFQKYTDDGYMIERIYQKKWDDSTEVMIIFETYISDTVSYNVSVIQRTKNKSLKKF
jgi:type III secretory pathway component EscR